MLAWIRTLSARHGVGVLVACLIGLAAMTGETVENSRDTFRRGTSRGGADDQKKDHLIREGATLEAELGEFSEWGERIRFRLKDEKISYVAVENLALERIANVLAENTTARTWSVSGVFTEYRGDNYLIVTRAALKARAKQPRKARPRD